MCLEDKPLTDFNKCSANPDGLQFRCKPCCAVASKKSRAKRLAKDPNGAKLVKQLWYQKNAEVSRERSRQYSLDHPEWRKEANKRNNAKGPQKAWREKFPEKARALQLQQSYKRRFRKHGLTEETYNKLKQDQNSRCMICGVVPTDNYGGLHDGFHIDHSHETGRVRGLLCKHCNVGIGMLKESEEILLGTINYLRKAKDLPPVTLQPSVN